MHNPRASPKHLLSGPSYRDGSSDGHMASFAVVWNVALIGCHQQVEFKVSCWVAFCFVSFGFYFLLFALFFF